MTYHHIGAGRFGLNIVCGWYQKEFDMLGVDLGTHDRRYDLGQEWIDIVTRVWSEDEPFDYDGEFFTLRRTVLEPKPADRRRPMLVCAGASETGRAFALRNADMLFNVAWDLDAIPDQTAALRRDAAAIGREVGVFTNAYVVCRPTAREAEEFHHYYAVEHADSQAVETMVVERGLDRPGVPEERRRLFRLRAAGGNGAMPIVGDPDDVAERMRVLSVASRRSPSGCPTICGNCLLSVTKCCRGWSAWGCADHQATRERGLSWRHSNPALKMRLPSRGRETAVQQTSGGPSCFEYVMPPPESAPSFSPRCVSPARPGRRM